ncbi:MAG: phosphoribosylformylglycinamidine cyclo-ligase [Gammaproteobacteria bacterium]|nr:phosphoribosylformylglycinamidine cyclo-ligase [Gammaproteobacteria bacterium]
MTLTYRDAGVDIDAGNRLVDRIKPLAAATRRAGMLGGLGGFGALFDPAAAGFNRAILVATTDGVGTKLMLAGQLGRHDTIGIDLVAMCANDIVVQGAEPLFFLDYFATGRLDVATAETIVAGIARGCSLAGCALVGGETAEMPDLYRAGEYDLAGFCVGAVEADRIIDGSRVAAGDAVLGLASSGVHSNGYSLVRKVLAASGTKLDTQLDGRPLGEILLEPTRIYVRAALELARRVPVHAIAHITGGGLIENVPRVLPAGTGITIDAGTWPRPAVFDWLQRTGDIPAQDMLRTFNMGIGMVLIVPAAQTDAALAALAAAGEQAWRIGTVEAASGAERVRFSGRL